MSLTLILTRHAKSDWGTATLSDKMRPLNARGRRDAPKIGAWLTAQGVEPQRAIVSTAERTVETWALIAGALPNAPSPEFQDRLYHASAETILDVLSTARAEIVHLIGHNPGIAEAAHRLVATAPEHPRFADYPTGATLVCTFDVARWSDIHWGAGHPLAFVTPHDL